MGHFSMDFFFAMISVVICFFFLYKIFFYFCIYSLFFFWFCSPTFAGMLECGDNFLMFIKNTHFLYKTIHAFVDLFCVYLMFCCLKQMTKGKKRLLKARDK